MANSAEEFDLVDFKSLAGAPAVTESTSSQLRLNVLGGHFQSGWQTLYDGDECLTVTFSRRQVSKHVIRLPFASHQTALNYATYSVGSLPRRDNSSIAACLINCESASWPNHTRCCSTA